MTKKPKSCSCCSNDTENIFSGVNGAICRPCIELYLAVLLGRRAEHKSHSNTISPSKIHAALDEYVIGQEKAKKILAVAAYNHIKKIENNSNKDKIANLDKTNALLIGPTGTGKTYLVGTLAKILNVPFAMADATVITEAGYIGSDAEDILLPLLKACDMNVEDAEKGIVYIDEIDKIAKHGESNSQGASRQGAQRGLLKILEGTIAKVKTGKHTSIEVNTNNILFILGGAFADLSANFKSKKEHIGFTATLEDKEADSIDYSAVSSTDLIEYGFMPEFIGRIAVIAPLDSLKLADLVTILTKPKNSLVSQYTALLNLDGVELTFTEEALEEIAVHALKKKSGARGLRAITEKVLLDIMYSVPDYQIEKITVTKEVVKSKL